MSHREEHALSSRFDLEAAMSSGECPVCHCLGPQLDRYMDAINYEAVNDTGFRKSFLDAQGFCNVHAYVWLQRAFVLGTASLYRELLTRMLDDDTESTHGMRIEDRIAQWFGRPGSADTATTNPHRPCPMCVWLARTETGLVSTLIASLDDPAFTAAYAQGVGLCIPHLQLALSQHAPHPVQSILDNRARITEHLLVDQLGEIIRKHDYRFNQEPPGAETGAAGRAIAFAIGFHGLIPRS